MGDLSAAVRLGIGPIMAGEKYRHTYATHTTVNYTVQRGQETSSWVPQPSLNLKIDPLKCTTFASSHPAATR